MASEADGDTTRETDRTGGLGGPFAPLSEPLFRRIWSASLFSNFGVLIQGVGAAWAMTQMTGRADLVAMVQSATFAPLMLGAIASGAIADMYDKRKIALVALSICLSGAVCLALLSLTGLLSPFLLLASCFIVGIGSALFSPAWQASVREQVRKEDLAAAVALNSISYNVARTFGPAIGGVLVAIAGVVSAFVVNAFFYMPLLIVTYLWRRTPEPSRLPPEGLSRAVISGTRFVLHSPPIRTICLRTLVIVLAGSSLSALMPMIARQLLHGDATTYGLLLGTYGVGAVGGAIAMPMLRRRLRNETIEGLAALITGLCVIAVSQSRSMPVTGLILMVAGSTWMVAVAICNISVQLSAPRWVGGRALAMYQSSMTAGVVIGSWAWGRVANGHGTDIALLASGLAMIATISCRYWLRMPDFDDRADHSLHEATDIPDPVLELTGRSGPIVITIEYRIDRARAREFYRLMQQVQLIRQRTGAYGWSISRDVADPEWWIERYHTPTWHDYLRQRSRLTQAEHDITTRALALHSDEHRVRVRRFLERPYGSVRLTEDAPDTGTDIITPLTTAQG